jgi:hypothetical protein
MARAFYVTVKSKGGKNPVDWFKQIDDRVHFEFQAKLVELGEQTAQRMKDILLSSNYNLTKLADSINSEFTNITAGVEVRIGNIAGFPKGEDGRDYWNAFNDGWLPPANSGFFGDGEAPSPEKSGQKWTHTGKDFYMQPKKPIEPLKYVDIAAQEMTAHIQNAVKEIMADIERNA